MEFSHAVGMVLIGRNEGNRLVEALTAARSQAEHIVYVDSGSTDGSRDAARKAGADVVELDLSKPFTAARSRNEGFARLLEIAPDIGFVQFIDGDCALQPGWIDTALEFLNNAPKAAVACGRRREKFPQTSVYNRLIDKEWDTPVGQAKSCGGDALMRVEAFREVSGFNPALIAGEEPELCVRLRQAGWTVWRLDAEMTRHDADLTKFSQWWKRTRRAGHAYAEGAALHGRPPENHNTRETRSILIWGVGFPLLLVLGFFVTPWALLILAVWPLQVLRLGLKSKDWSWAAFLTLGKFPEAWGVLEYWWGRLRGTKTRLIEYK